MVLCVNSSYYCSTMTLLPRLDSNEHLINISALCWDALDVNCGLRDGGGGVVPIRGYTMVTLLSVSARAPPTPHHTALVYTNTLSQQVVYKTTLHSELCLSFLYYSEVMPMFHVNIARFWWFLIFDIFSLLIKVEGVSVKYHLFYHILDKTMLKIWKVLDICFSRSKSFFHNILNQNQTNIKFTPRFWTRGTIDGKQSS